MAEEGVGRIPLPKGEGGAKHRVRGTDELIFMWNSSPAASRHPLPSGEGFVPKYFPWTARHATGL
jgi:hypothetical protein